MSDEGGRPIPLSSTNMSTILMRRASEDYVANSTAQWDVPPVAIRVATIIGDDRGNNLPLSTFFCPGGGLEDFDDDMDEVERQEYLKGCKAVLSSLLPLEPCPKLPVKKVESFETFKASALREEERSSVIVTELTNSVSQEPIGATPKENLPPSEAEQGTKDSIAYTAKQWQAFQGVERAELINEINHLQSVVEKESKKAFEHAELVNEVKRLKSVVGEKEVQEEEEEDEEEDEEHRAKVENFWKAFYERKFNKWKTVHEKELEVELTKEIGRLEGAVEEVSKRSSEEIMSQKIAHCRAIKEMEESVSKALQENRRPSLLVKQLRDERWEIGAVTEIVVGKLESKDLDSSMHRQPSMSTASTGSDSDDFECLRKDSGSSLSSSPYSSWQADDADSSTDELGSPRRKMPDKLAAASGWATPESLSPCSPWSRAQSFPAQRAVTDFVAMHGFASDIFDEPVWSGPDQIVCRTNAYIIPKERRKVRSGPRESSCYKMKL